MTQTPHFLLVDPAHFDVSYVINPWMDPAAWSADPAGQMRAARAGFDGLRAALQACGAMVDVLPGQPGLPDMVFPANAAVVLDGRAIVARFSCPERQGEEVHFQAGLAAYIGRGLSEVASFPPGCFQEGAGDAIWDQGRGLFWAGYGQRSLREAADAIHRFFGRNVVPLQLASPRFYHLDTCFCPLAGGEVLYYPPAFTEASLAEIERRVAPEQRLIASEADAAAFCVNAVNIGRDVVMARPAAHVKALLEGRGYRVHGVDLDPFILSGGGAYCMTLRLDRTS